MIAPLIAWWTVRKSSSLFMPIIIGVVSLFIVTTVGAGALFVNGLKKDRDRAINEAIALRVRAQTAEQSLVIQRRNHEELVRKFTSFGQINAQIETSWGQILVQSNGIDHANVVQAARDLNRIGADNLRMLESISRGR